MHFKPSGLIPIGAGTYLLLIVYRVVPSLSKDPERMELWHRKFDKLMKIVSPLLIGFGFLQSLGVL
jgi:hypothetical protein